MRGSEKPVCIDIFRQNPFFTSLQLKSLVHVVYRLWILMDQFYLLAESGGWGTGKAETEVHTHHRPTSRHSAPTTHQRLAFISYQGINLNHRQQRTVNSYVSATLLLNFVFFAHGWMASVTVFS
jgi:hypothetical protein